MHKITEIPLPLFLITPASQMNGQMNC